MITLEFSEQDLADIEEACDAPTLPEKLTRKLMCLRMHKQKVRDRVIASVMNISPYTVTIYLKEFDNLGISGTLEDRAYIQSLKGTIIAAPHSSQKPPQSIQPRSLFLLALK
ncbi:helix-turn-helix domain-containing protein [Rubritalea profundi]|uniref:Uncharacterized protein n=1 Tax=Rubritalea profundi TaxID=1658618 RepID=A0A2S7U325_9BACT|nr:helix-turn-helix domain-containing protein [Rubritalea profundi]PQJ29396.1 hypothetical protein BSZ32_13475 [Rubritalea profundi]